MDSLQLIAVELGEGVLWFSTVEPMEGDDMGIEDVAKATITDEGGDGGV